MPNPLSTLLVLLLTPAMLAHADPATQPAPPAFKPVQGQRIEAFWVRQWWSATVREVRGDQALIRHDQRAGSEEWVPLNTIRKFTKAARYPMPATQEEIDLQDQLEDQARETRLQNLRSRAANRPTPPAARPSRPDEFVDADVSPMNIDDVIKLSDNPELPLAGIAPDPEPRPKTLVARPMPLSGNPREARGQTARPAGLFAAPGAGHLFALSEVAGSQPVKLLQRFDAATGNPFNVLAIESSLTINAVSPDGTRAVGANSHRKGHFGQPPAVEVWSIDKPPAKLLLSFTPAIEGVDATFLQLARFIDSDHLLTLTLGNLICWSIPDAKAVYHRDLGRGAVIALSPTSKYLAAADGASLRLIESATGTHLGQLPPATPPIRAAHLAFSPTGKRLLASENQRIVLYDLDNPAVVADIALPAPLTGGVFLSDDYLLVSRRYVVDVAKGIVLWDYPHGAGPSRAFAGRLWYLSEPQPPYTPSLYSAAIPTDQAIKAPARLNPDDIYAVQPGTPISFDLNTGLPGDEHLKAVAALQNAARAAGLTVDDNAPTRLIASHASSDSKEIEYRLFGGERRKVSVATHTYTLTIEQNGQTLWKTSASIGPSYFIHLKKDESIEQHLEDQRHRSAAAFFTTARLPKYLAKPTDTPGLGQTLLPGAPASTNAPAKPAAPPRNIPRTRV